MYVIPVFIVCTQGAPGAPGDAGADGRDGEKVCKQFLTHQAPVVQRMDNAIQSINHYPVDSIVICLLDGVIHP